MRTGLFPVKLAGVALIMAAASTQPAAAQVKGDAAVGAKLYVQCRACHTITKGGASTLGPNLFGVVGAKAAQKTYAYSPAMKKSNIVWTPQKLDAWLVRPSAVVPGTKMAFAGISNPQARASLIAYMASQK